MLTHPGVNLDVTFRVYKAYPAAIREGNIEGMMPLHVALNHGANEDVVKFLLDEWQGCARVITRSGLTALHFAVHTPVERNTPEPNHKQQQDIRDKHEESTSPTDETTTALHTGGDSITPNQQVSKRLGSQLAVVNVNVVKLIHRKWPYAIQSPAGQLGLTPPRLCPFVWGPARRD